MRILSIVLRRLVSTIPTLFVATFFVFALQKLIPGDPARAIAGDYATKEQMDRIRAQLGLDRPFLVQYFDWIGHAFTGDLGKSLHTGQPVAGLVFERLPLTLIMMVAALVVALVIGVPTGIWASTKADTVRDRFVTTAATFGLAIPNFWLGMILIIVFALKLHWLPGPGGPMLAEDPGQALRGLILPSVALGLVGAAEVCRQVRSAMIESLLSDYVRTHRAKGLGERAIVWRHALKNSSVPLATIVGLQVSHLLSGAVVIEAVFGLSGIGSQIVDATNERDYTVLQGIVFVTAVIVIVANLIVDVSYRVLDPRIR